MTDFETKLKDALSSSFMEYCRAAKHPDTEERDGPDWPRNEFPDVNSYQTFKAMEIIRPEIARLQTQNDTQAETIDKLDALREREAKRYEGQVERVYQMVRELRAIVREMREAMLRYQRDSDCDIPFFHNEMMDRARAALES